VSSGECSAEALERMYDRALQCVFKADDADPALRAAVEALLCQQVVGDSASSRRLAARLLERTAEAVGVKVGGSGLVRIRCQSH
jgi:hypothetical protein